MSDQIHVYILFCFSHPFTHTKIGVASNVRDRLAALQTGNPFELELLEAIPVAGRAEALRVEKKAHDLLAEFRTGGEWFDCGNDLAWLAVQVALGKRPYWQLSGEIEKERAYRKVAA